MVIFIFVLSRESASSRRYKFSSELSILLDAIEHLPLLSSKATATGSDKGLEELSSTFSNTSPINELIMTFVVSRSSGVSSLWDIGLVVSICPFTVRDM